MALRKFNVASPINYRDTQGNDKTFWHVVGKAWETQKGDIAISLNSYPLPDPDEGRVKMFLFEDDEKSRPVKKEKADDGRPIGKQIDDEVPF